MSNLTFEHYLQIVQFSTLLKELGVQNVETLNAQIQHFTEKEAEKRDEIVLSYFGAEGGTTHCRLHCELFAFTAKID